MVFPGVMLEAFWAGAGSMYVCCECAHFFGGEDESGFGPPSELVSLAARGVAKPENEDKWCKPCAYVGQVVVSTRRGTHAYGGLGVDYVCRVEAILRGTSVGEMMPVRYLVCFARHARPKKQPEKDEKIRRPQRRWEKVASINWLGPDAGNPKR